MMPSLQSNLVLYNDDVNSFEWVIDCLVKECFHHPIQAEQCAYLVHYTGQCIIKVGDAAELKPMCDALVTKGLHAQIHINHEAV
ncbi:MAG: ATP-dependent Clp protease adaptor ClpS [Bacteroidetes bacterium]|nr:ATP-dependent Clp protease adaptor ClpS [Bacteroidota bacterium]